MAVTHLMAKAAHGDQAAADTLLPLVYDELRRLAQHHLGSERRGHTLQATALVHEAYLRLIGSDGPGWEDRRQFFLAAGKAIRRILIDHARTRDRAKRGGGAPMMSLKPEDAFVSGIDLNVLALDEALRRLATEDEQIGQVVELRFFAGLSVDDTALALNLSPRTVARHWQFARVWLSRALDEGL